MTYCRTLVEFGSLNWQLLQLLAARGYGNRYCNTIKINRSLRGISSNSNSISFFFLVVQVYIVTHTWRVKVLTQINNGGFPPSCRGGNPGRARCLKLDPEGQPKNGRLPGVWEFETCQEFPGARCPGWSYPQVIPRQYVAGVWEFEPSSLVEYQKF